jgi:POT family proton-dependent oligopeptide transporter
MATITTEAVPHSRRGLVFGHPRALVFLAGTELWDRISFHGMQALLVLYMVEQLLLPGHIKHIAGCGAARATIEFVTGPLSTQALATQIFGLYVGFVSLMPVFGGLLGDRLLGRVRAITLGALLMTAGHFCMAFDASFLLALLLLIIGAGLLRGNLVPQVGELYSVEDRRRDTAFQVYYSMVNLGAFVSPIVTGFLAQYYGWHIGFAFAGFGMLLGLIIYLSGRKELPPERARGSQHATQPLNPAEWRVVRFLIAMVPVNALFWVAQSQVWNTYNLWVRDHIELRFGGWRMPVPWLQSLDGLAPFVLVPPALLLWRWQARQGREPNEPTKMAIGCFIFSASTLWLAGAPLWTDAAGRTPFLWAVMFHIGSNIGWIYFAPIVIALYSRTAPKAVNATMIGVYYLSVFLGSVVSGRLGGLYEKLTASQFWILHAAIVAAGGAIFLVFAPTLRRAFAAEGAALADRRGVAVQPRFQRRER